MPPRDNDQWSQADERSYRVFRDQHGRRWGADTEDSTGGPCGPLALLAKDPLVCAPPIMPPQAYIRVTDVAAGELEINYDRWLESLDEALQDYEVFAFQQAEQLYKDQAAAMLQDMPPQLRLRIGRDRPMDRRVVLAMKAGNAWILGLSTDRPAWADQVMPTTQRADEYAFLQMGMEEKESQEVTDALQGQRYYQGLRTQAKELGLNAGRNPTTEDLEKLIEDATPPTPEDGEQVEHEQGATVGA